MVDIEYLKKKCLEYSTTDLLKIIFLQAKEFIPEALEVYKNELKKREADIQDLLKKEFLKTGSIEHTISHVQTAYKNPTRTVTGNIYLTSNALFFIQKNIVNEGILTHGTGAYLLGPLGLIIDEIALSISKKDLSFEIKDNDLPLSLLVDIVEYSYVAYIRKIEIIDYWLNGRFQIDTHDKEKRELYFEKSNLDILKSWIDSHSITSSQKHAFWKKLF